MDLDSLIPDEEELPKMTHRERYAASPPSPSMNFTSVGQLLSSKDAAQVNRARELLQRESRYGLWCKLVGATNKRARITAWLSNCEYTRRGVPPVFRDALVIKDDDMELRLDSVAVDLEWIATTYPAHQTFFERWRKFVDPRYFDSQLRYIFNGMGRGQTRPDRAIKGLALDDQQQRELHYLRYARYHNAFHQLMREKEGVRWALEQRYIAGLPPNRGPMIELLSEDRAIIQRRVNVWLCGHLADWSPTRTAQLYNVLTGAGESTEPSIVARLTRQQANNVMNDLERDLPGLRLRPAKTKRRPAKRKGER